MSTVSCPHCQASNPAGSAFCESCGKALPMADTGPRIVSGSDLASTAAGRQLQSDELLKKVRSASGALLAVAILVLLGGLCLFGIISNMSSEQFEDPTMDVESAAMFVLISNLVVSAVYFALYFWARKSPFPAAIVGLVLFITLQVVNALVDPTTLAQGWIVKIIIIAVLVKAVQAGAQYRRLIAQSEGSPA